MNFNIRIHVNPRTCLESLPVQRRRATLVWSWCSKQAGAGWAAGPEASWARPVWTEQQPERRIKGKVGKSCVNASGTCL